ncbi:MAG: pentapeptide repeat-containing protein [Promethearchaeota archaeon]|jgi:uncharacterized protein YjbI with pentapeptide repeats
MSIEIKNFKVEVIYRSDKENIKEALEDAVKEGSNLTGANLTGADLTGTYLKDADLRGVNVLDKDKVK